MRTKENMNVAELTRDLGWKVRGKKYQHLLILLEYLTLCEALSLLITKEKSS